MYVDQTVNAVLKMNKLFVLVNHNMLEIRLVVDQSVLSARNVRRIKLARIINALTRAQMFVD